MMVVNQYDSTDIIIYSQAELSTLIEKRKLHDVRPSNLQSTIWATSLEFHEYGVG